MFLGSKNLYDELNGNDVIDNFDPKKIKNGAYELCLGSQVFQTESKPRSIRNLAPGEEIYIQPGQFALLLTEEFIKIPENRIAFISIKAGIKFQGLVNVSGFHVDPGFQGKLLFSVYNAGSYTIPLRRGEGYFPMWFSELNETQPYSGSHAGQREIPLQPVAALSQGDLASPSALLEKMKDDYKTLDKKIDDSDTGQAQRIELIEKEQKAIDYLVKTAVGLGIVILLKFGFDFTAFSSGREDGKKYQKTVAENQEAINKLLGEKKSLLLEIDSLERSRTELINLKSGSK